jgi:hypothetical protein
MNTCTQCKSKLVNFLMFATSTKTFMFCNRECAGKWLNSILVVVIGK